MARWAPRSGPPRPHPPPRPLKKGKLRLLFFSKPPPEMGCPDTLPPTPFWTRCPSTLPPPPPFWTLGMTPPPPPRPMLDDSHHVPPPPVPPPEGMHICPITGKWREGSAPPRSRPFMMGAIKLMKATTLPNPDALMRTVWGCVIAILSLVLWGTTGTDWAIPSLVFGCFLMSKRVIRMVLRTSAEQFANAIQRGLEHDRQLREMREGVHRGPAESRPMQPGQMIDPRPMGTDGPLGQGRIVLPPDDVVVGADAFERWVLAETKLTWNEWLATESDETETPDRASFRAGGPW